MRKAARSLLVVSVTLLANAGWMAGCFSADDTGSTPGVDAGTFDAGTFDATGFGDAHADAAPVDATTDSSPDAGARDASDASIDAAADVAVDAAIDATVDAPVDAPVDAVVDAPIDAPLDVGTDASLGGGTFVYEPGSSVLRGWVLQASGALVQIDMDTVAAGVQDIATGTNPLSMTAHPAGNFVYTGNYGNSTIGAYAVNPVTGALTRLDTDNGTAGIQDLSTVPHGNPAFVAADPQGRLIYSANDGDNTLASYSVDTVTGLLTFVASISVATAPRGIAVDAQARFLAVVGDSGALTMCLLDAVTGLPTAVDADNGTAGRQDFTIGTNTVSIALNAAGTYLYGASLGTGALDAFSVNTATAVVTSIATPATTGPLNVVVSPSGGQTFVADYSLNRIDAFSNAGNGVPTSTGANYFFGSPRALAFDPAAKHLIVGGDNGTVAVFAWDSTTGALTQVGSTVSGPIGSYAFAFAVH